MLSSRITQRHQATIPAEMYEVFDLHRGDLVEFAIHGKEVIIGKSNLSDLAWARALQQTVSEWGSEEDDRLYANL